MASSNRYQYETSPRKLEPEYIPSKNKKSTDRIKKEIKQRVKQNAKINKKDKLLKRKVVVYIAISFSILLAISYRNSLINENFAEIKNLKNNLATVEKENQQLQINIENDMNLNNVEQQAKEKLGMQKLNNNQKIYINLPKEDYVQPASEKVVINKNENWFNKILNYIKEK